MHPAKLPITCAKAGGSGRSRVCAHDRRYRTRSACAKRWTNRNGSEAQARQAIDNGRVCGAVKALRYSPHGFRSVPAETPQRQDSGPYRVGGEDGEVGAAPAEPEPRVLHGGDEMCERQHGADVTQAHG